MIKVRMNVSISGTDFSYQPQQEVELEDELAKIWDEIGHCSILEPPKKAGGKVGSKAK